ncbi:hypothetical protein ES705_45106 [subsurface metagenome]|jgi:hypothetical protein
MKRGVLKKIRRLEQFWVEMDTPRGVRKYGPYWRGVYWANDREKTVYLGKELPGSLKYLLAGRVKRRGYKNYAWLGRKEGGGQNVNTKGKREGSKTQGGRVKEREAAAG